MAGAALPEVRPPTLLIVGGDDLAVLDRNRAALDRQCEKGLEIVPGVGHLFEGPGALDKVMGPVPACFVRQLREEAAA